MYFSSDNHDNGSGGPVAITNLVVSGCYADGNTTSEGSSPGNGIFRATGGSATSITMTDCEFKYNKSILTGGAITWQAGAGSDTKLTLKGSDSSHKCKIHHNEGGNGGGIYTTTIIDFQAVEINNNSATNGGGIFIGTYGTATSTSTDENRFCGLAPSISLSSNSSIHDNTALDIGGGIYFRIAPSNGVGFDPNGNPISPEFKVELDGGREHYPCAR